MDCDHGLIGGVVEIEQHLADQDVGDALLGPDVGARRVPCRGQVARQRHQGGLVDLRPQRGSLVVPGDARLKAGDALQRRIPSAFQLARDQALGGIDCLIPPGGQ